MIDSSCHYLNPNTPNSNCVKFQDCPAEATEADCPKITPPDYHTYKCVFGASCRKEKRTCDEFGQKQGDVCRDLYPGADSGKRCDFSEIDQCKPYFDECDVNELNSETSCESNIPSDYSQKCKWIEASAENPTAKCEKVTRNCQDIFQRNNEDACKTRIASNENKACIFINGLCYEKYPTCGSYKEGVEIDCNSVTPFNTANTNLDYSIKCELDDRTCKQDTKTCGDYELGDFTLLPSIADAQKCSYAKASNEEKFRCNYDSSTDDCVEIERECSFYNEKDGTKTKEECEKIVPSNPNKKCIFESGVCKEDNRKCEEIGDQQQCQTLALTKENVHCIWISGGNPPCIENYDSCASYKGDDKKTCINIVLNTRNKCELKHDLICEEGDFSCTMARNEAECKMAKPTPNTGKKCVYYDGTCYEQYAKCGDYKGTDSTICRSIDLHNGKKCVYEDNKCKTELKQCSEANDKK